MAEATGTPSGAVRAASYFSYRHPGQLAMAPLAPRRVLDIGCGSGEALAEFRARGAVRTVGIEIDPGAGAVAAARPDVDVVLVGDVEETLAQVTDHAFDLVIASHVLEHLVDPWTVTRRLVALLAPGGSLLGGVPNVRHAPTVARLLVRGSWEYADAGILDRTHLRFFTRRSLEDMLTGAGLRDVTIRPDFGASRHARRLNQLTFGRLSDLWAFAYDFHARTPTLGDA